MSPLLFVQENNITRLSYPLAQAWRERGWDIHSLCFDNDVPRKYTGEPSIFLDRLPIFVYGSVSMLNWTLKHPSLSPWSFSSVKSFDPWNWVILFRGHTLNWPRIMAVQDLRETPGFHHDGEFHARPVDVHKAFQGGVYDLDALAKLNLPPDLRIGLSSIREISAEFRVWVIGGQVVEVSQYRAFGKPMPIREGYFVDEAREYAEIILKGHKTPEEHIVMDVALINKNGVDHWCIVEFNPINSSGWYAADVGKIIDSFVEYYR